MDETPRCEDDATLVQRVTGDRDEGALTELMARHAPKVTGDLRHRFRHQLQHPDIDEAVNRAAMKFWKNAHRFDRSRPFGPWFLAVAHRAALDILRGEERRPTCELGFDPPDPDSGESDEPPARSPRMAWYVEQLEQIIDSELKGFEQSLARADLAAGGRADTELLMKQHDKTKGVVQATRSKVWRKVRETITAREAMLARTRVNQ